MSFFYGRWDYLIVDSSSTYILISYAHIFRNATIILNQPNLRGVADTFKEQVAEALGNPDDIEMYPHVGCSFDACCSYEDSEDSKDIKMYHKECTCPQKKRYMCGGGHRIPPRPP